VQLDHITKDLHIVRHAVGGRRCLGGYGNSGRVDVDRKSSELLGKLNRGEDIALAGVIAARSPS
jgi:hypothetical protein